MLDYCKMFRELVKRFVDHRYFQGGILIAILINTLSMGIEFHNQASCPSTEYDSNII